MKRQPRRTACLEKVICLLPAHKSPEARVRFGPARGCRRAGASAVPAAASERESLQTWAKACKVSRALRVGAVSALHWPMARAKKSFPNMRAGVSKDHTVAAQFAAARHRADPDGLREGARYELGAWSDRFYNSARLCHLVHSTVTETLVILLNCDTGESFGIWRLLIHIANVACSFHASDFNHMRTTVQLAKKHDVRVKANPSLPDRQGFGRRQTGSDELARACASRPSSTRGMSSRPSTIVVCSAS